MKFIIFICSHLQHGEYPRLPDFPYNEALGKYIYQGRELTLEEFNEAALVVFDPKYRTSGYAFAPQIIADEVVVQLTEAREVKKKTESSYRKSRTASMKAVADSLFAPSEPVADEDISFDVPEAPVDETAPETEEATPTSAPLES